MVTPPTTRMMTNPPITETQRSQVALRRCSAIPVVSRSSDARMMLDRKTLASSISALPRLLRNKASASASRRSLFRAIVRSISSNFSAITSVSRLHHAAGLREGASEALQAFELGLGLRLGVVVRRQIDFVAADQEAALAGFGALQRAAQFDRRDPGIAHPKASST